MVHFLDVLGLLDVLFLKNALLVVQLFGALHLGCLKLFLDGLHVEVVFIHLVLSLLKSFLDLLWRRRWGGVLLEVDVEGNWLLFHYLKLLNFAATFN